jgi:hypothetical protein
MRLFTRQGAGMSVPTPKPIKPMEDSMNIVRLHPPAEVDRQLGRRSLSDDLAATLAICKAYVPLPPRAGEIWQDKIDAAYQVTLLSVQAGTVHYLRPNGSVGQFAVKTLTDSYEFCGEA